MSVVAIINPISGAGSNDSVRSERVALVRAEAERRGLRVEINLTERAGHAREMAAAAAAAGAELVIAWGGDGTLNEAGSALLDTGTTLGVVPAGSGNGLAAALAVPRDPRTALAVAFDGRTGAIDAGTIAGRPFFNIAGVGFDARVAKLFNAIGSGPRGGWPYIKIGVREGCTYRGSHYRLELDGTEHAVHALLIAFANGREYGMGARIAPQAELDDGWLDAFVVIDRAVMARFWHARHLAFGSAHLAPNVTTQRVRHAVIEAPGPIDFHVDGEPDCAHDRLEVRIRPGALKVRVG
ncbi:MAG TPA: diacylglycerol kinase family protein [Vicinamibacterales bacterium]